MGGLAAANGIPAQSALPWVLNEINTHIGGTALMGGDTSQLTLSDLFGSTIPFHAAARQAANANMLVPGTAEFNAALEASRSNPLRIVSGSKVEDVSQILNYEVDYDFGDKLGFGNLIVGAVYRDYKLETGGTLYTDYSAPIKYQEYGGYAQLKSNILQDKVTMTASV